MPYEIIKYKNGYKVMNKETKKTYSNNAMTYDNALKQMRLLYMLENMPHSAYKSMRLAQLNLAKKTTKRNEGALKKWKDEEWLNLNALLRNIYSPCGQKVKEQGNEPTVCRPRYDKSDKTHKTPQPLAETLSKKQIRKAIEIKKQKKRIQWSKL